VKPTEPHTHTLTPLHSPPNPGGDGGGGGGDHGAGGYSHLHVDDLDAPPRTHHRAATHHQNRGRGQSKFDKWSSGV